MSILDLKSHIHLGCISSVNLLLLNCHCPDNLVFLVISITSSYSIGKQGRTNFIYVYVYIFSVNCRTMYTYDESISWH